MGPDSRTGILLSSKESREVMGRIVGGGRGSPRRIGVNARRGGSLCPRQGRRGPLLFSVGRNKIRLQMHRQRSVLFHGPSSEGWGCRVGPEEFRSISCLRL